MFGSSGGYQPPQGVLQQLIQQHLASQQFQGALSGLMQPAPQGPGQPSPGLAGGGFLPPNRFAPHPGAQGFAGQLAGLFGGQHQSYPALPQAPDDRGGGHQAAQSYPGLPSPGLAGGGFIPPNRFTPTPPGVGAGEASNDNMVKHFTQVHAAQNLARFLAQQHTGGLRRYNGRY